MNLFELGQALKEMRLSRRLTQSELASRTGVSLSSISGLERGILPEIGTVKLLQLFAAVGLELQPREQGQRRTLDDIKAESAKTPFAQTSLVSNIGVSDKARQRVRHSRKEQIL
jgi:transcriptional regulator with XRE-family HTH domain